MLTVTEIAWDGRMRRRMVGTAHRSDAGRWELIGCGTSYQIE